MGEMKQVLVGGANGITINSDRYVPFIGFPWSDGQDSLETDGELIHPGNIMPYAGTLGNLHVWASYVTGMNASNKMVLTVLKNGVATGITVTFDSDAAQFKSDSNTEAFLAGDILTLHFDETGKTFSEWCWCATYTIANEFKSIHGGTEWGVGTPDVGDEQELQPGETEYGAPCGEGPLNTEGEYRKIIVPCDGTISDLYVGISNYSGSSTNVFTIRKNGVDTSLTVTATTSNNLNMNTTNSVTVKEGDLITYKCYSTGEYADLHSISFVFTADIPGYYPIFGTCDIRPTETQIATSSRYISGRTYRTDWAVAAPTSGYAQCDQLATAMKIKGISVYKSDTSDSRTYTLFNKGSSTGLSVTVAGAKTGVASGDVDISDDDAIYTVVTGCGEGETWEAISYIGFDEAAFEAAVKETWSAAKGCSNVHGTVFTGLSHLEGQTVGILADGVVMAQQVVTAGAITVDSSYNVKAGLPYTSEFETLNIEENMKGGSLQGQPVKISNVTFRLLNTRGGHIGPNADTTYEAFTTAELERAVEIAPAIEFGAAKLFNVDVRVPLGAGYEMGGRIYYKQVDPLPVTISAIIPEVTV